MTALHELRAEPIVVSMTDFGNYRRCKNLFRYSWVEQLIPTKRSEAADLGSAFHAYVAAAANEARGVENDEELHDSPAMLEVAQAYLRDVGLPPGSDILAVEEQFYVLVLPEEDRYGDVRPAVYIRITPDLVFREGDWIRVRDYKTFDRAPSLESDLNFQATKYIVCARQVFKTQKVVWDWRYVRRELGRYIKSGRKKTDDVVWTDWEYDERYITTPDLIISDRVADVAWAELQQTARELRTRVMRAQDAPQHVETLFYREPLNGPINGCLSCFYRQICVTRLENGDDASLDGIVAPPDPSARMSARGLIRDPRVVWRARDFASKKPLGFDPADNRKAALDAVALVYGAAGAEKAKRLYDKYPQP